MDHLWVCSNCNAEVESKIDPLYCEDCGVMNFKDLGDARAYHDLFRKKRDASE